MVRDRSWAENKARELVSKMTLEEKASQLRFNSDAIERLNIPSYNWWNEGLHGVARAGVATMFPQAIALAAMFDEQLIEKVADIISTEGRAKYNEYSKRGDRDIYKGLTYWSPNVNIFRDPRWGRGHETYGEDPYLTSRLGVAFVKGLQGDNKKYLKLAACAKHYAVHSGPEAKRHFFDAKASKKDLWETYLPAFEALVKEADVEAVMGAYNRTNGEPCCANTYLMDKVLRGLWNFKGHYVSDCWAVKDFHENHKVTSSPEESVSLALKKGCDVNCGCTYKFILSAVKKGLVKEEDIDRSAIRLFTTRFLLGLGEKTPFDSLCFDDVETKEHVDFAIETARKSIVLLKNDGILPLDKKQINSIGVVGPNANSRLSLIGNYHGTSSRYITVLEAIQDEVEQDGIKVNYSEGCHLFKDRISDLAESEDRIAEAEMVADNSDVVIVCLGLDETLEGEEQDQGNSAFDSGDKRDLKLPESQRILYEKMLQTGKPLIVILLAGSSIDLSREQETANGIIQAWYPGARGGIAVSDILFGKCSPSGKLPVTFYKSIDAIPDFEDYSMENRTYRHLKDESNVLYPFGYGLTYGKLKIDSAKVISKNDDIKLKVTVTNPNKKEIEDVVQVYVKDDSEFGVENYSLCSFKRVCVTGEKSYEMIIPRASLNSIDDMGISKIRNDKFKLYIGFSQPDLLSEILTHSKSVELDLDL